MIWLAVLLVISLAVTGWSLWMLRQQRQLVAKALVETQALNSALGAKPADAAALVDSPAPMLLTIEILNAMELAAERSWAASAIGGISPTFIRRKVYEQVRNILNEKLVEFGVEAEVNVHPAKAKRKK